MNSSATEITEQWRSIVRSLIETSTEPMVVVDDDLRVVAVNSAANSAFGKPDESLENRRLSEILRYPEIHNAFANALDQKTGSSVRLELISGKRHIFDVSVNPLPTENGVYAIGVFRNITKVERLERVRQEFLANISHELRTPLTAILAFIETLEDGAIDDAENGRRFLASVRRNAQRMHALIDDILELSFIESGNTSLDKRSINAAHCVDEVFNDLSAAAKGKNVDLINNISSDVAVFADPTRLDQMLTNLVDNAIKFNRENGSVEVRAEAREGRSLIEVIDTGEGIPPEHIKRIFERFYRGDRSRGREIGGTGLGLSIVKHLARLHGGEVYVTSKLGQGTTFHIELPAS